MPARTLILFLFLLVLQIATAQNLLPFDWKIAVTGTKPADIASVPATAWKDINLLLSWERQGYFGRDGHCLLKTDFTVPETGKRKNWILQVALQCRVEAISINGSNIGGAVPDYFWSERDKITSFTVPPDVLLPGRKNEIVIAVNGLSYTGGHSHNSCRLVPEDYRHEPGFAIHTATANHVFEAPDTSSMYITARALNGTMAIKIVNDFHRVIAKKEITLHAGSKDTIRMIPAGLAPGFYECTAVLHDSPGYSGAISCFAVSPDKIPVNNDTMPGYHRYWQEAKAELATIAPGFRMHKVDSLCSAYRDGYVVAMQSLGNLTIRGYYFVPKAPGKYPALLHVPGYGYGFEQLASFTESSENLVELALCVRGHGISADVFHPGFDVPGIWGWNLCSEKDNAYRAIYMDCVRAVDFLLSRPEIDVARIGVEGGSQGGGLALATAGLCSDAIKAMAYFDPFPANIRDHKQIRTIMDQELAAYLQYYNNACSLADVLHVQDLLNTAGFAHYIQCPVFFAAALFDDDCPPHVGFTAYNLLKTEKQYKIYPADSHLGESNYHKAFLSFFKDKFGFKRQ